MLHKGTNLKLPNISKNVISLNPQAIWLEKVPKLWDELYLRKNTSWS